MNKWFSCCIAILSLIIRGYSDDPVVLSSLTLEQAEMIALEKNHQVQTLRALYQKAVEGKLESYSKWMPTLSAFSDMYVANKKQVFTNSKSAFLTQFTLSQSILEMDKYYDVKIAKLVQEQLKLLLNAAIIDTLFEVRSLYYLVILDYESIAAAEDKVELLTSLANRMKDRYEVGTTILYNVNQSQVAIANAMAAYYEVVKAQKVNMDRLVSAMGFDPGNCQIQFAKLEIPVDTIPLLGEKLCHLRSLFEEDGLKADQKLFTKSYPLTEIHKIKALFSKPEISYWESKAKKYDPTLSASEKEVVIARREVSKGYGEYIPKVTLNVNYGGNPTDQLFVPATSFSSQTFEWGVGLQFKWMIFDSLGRERRIKQARYQKKAKESQYKKELQKTYENVRKQIFSIEEAISSFVTADANVRLATQTVDLANDQLDIGYVTIFDYQITVDGLVQALNHRNKARYEIINAYYGLRHASGADLEEEGM